MTQTPDTRFPCEMVSGVPVLVTPEEIDITNADGLRAALLDCYEHGHGRLVVDMGRTRFCDTAGLHALVDAHKRALAQGGQMRLVISDAVIQRIFAITGLDQVIPTFTTLQEACGSPPG
jgi:anti-sigma B factor antagonist